MDNSCNKEEEVNGFFPSGKRKALIAVGIALILIAGCYVPQVFFVLGLTILVAGMLEIITMLQERWTSLMSFGLFVLMTVIVAVIGAFFMDVTKNNTVFQFGGAIIMIALSDTFCQLCGQGMHKLRKKLNWGNNHIISAEVSPNKSWEGAIGSVLLCWWVYYLVQFLPSNSILQPVLGGMQTMPFWQVTILIVFAQICDFLNSATKRYLGIKDWWVRFGNKKVILLWDHGGFIDRFCAYLALCLVV